KNSPERPSRSRAFPIGERPAALRTSFTARSTSASDLGPSSAASAGNPTASNTSAGLSCSRNFSISFRPALKAALSVFGRSSASRRAWCASRSARCCSSSRSASCFAAALRKSTTRWYTSRVSWERARWPSTPIPAVATSGRPPFPDGSCRRSLTIRRTVRQERHVLLRNDPRDDPLVPVAARHLVAHGDLALLGDVHLHELDHARGELVRLQDLVDLVLGLLLDLGALRLRGVQHGAEPLVHLLVRHAQGLQVHVGEIDSVELWLGELRPGREVLFDGAGFEHQPDFLAGEQVAQLGEHRLGDAGLLLRLQPAHLADPLAPVLLDHLVPDPRDALHVDH